MKFYKLLFFNSMIFGTLIAISSYSWMSMWMGLEINLLSVIPLFSDGKNIFSSEASLKYFLTQAMASLVLLMSVIQMLSMNEFINPLMNFYYSMMLNSALLTKLGAAPFHFWFPEVIEGLSWLNSLILLTWQKIAPMVLLMNNKISFNFLMSVIIFSLMVSVTMGFNQISLRKIMAFSSINHIGWMLSTLMMSSAIWIIYFVVYSIISLNIILMFYLTKSYFMVQMNNILNQSKLIKFTFMVNFLSLGGLPPFIGFLPKWMVVNWLTQNNLGFLAFSLIILTLIMLFIYIRIIMSSMTLSSYESKIKSLEINNLMFSFMNTFTLTSLMLSTLVFNFM